MSDDLISRKAAVELVIAEYDSFQANGGSHSGRCELDKVIKMIQNMPTAFDKEKVVEELNRLRAIYFLTIANTVDKKLDCAYKYVGTALDKVIEIVEKGGLE